MTSSITQGAHADIGLIGLAVMGENLARNIERNGYSVAVFNRTAERTKAFVERFAEASFTPTYDLSTFVAALKRPRKIIAMVKAGSPVDELLTTILPLLEHGDIVIDGGNAHFEDTIRRELQCRSVGIHFLGVGISGGEEGALQGASIMPGGDRAAWSEVAPLFAKIAASVRGEPCTGYIGPDGAGHFVKMVHNGIEYGDMQLIAESYDILARGLEYTPDELSEVFSAWNKGPLESFLIEITAKIFGRRDDGGGDFVVNRILDKAGQKGTGKWTVISALDLGITVPTIAAAVDARVLSSMKEERVAASESFHDVSVGLAQELTAGDVHDALYAAKVLSYAQGLALLRAASDVRSWALDLGQIAKLWRGGCIIRARFLDEIARAYAELPSLPNLLLAPEMRSEMVRTEGALRRVVSYGAVRGLPTPALSASLAYFDSYRTARLPQNLTQAQRDFFGAHTFERIDKPGTYHVQWE